jgi:hypothetical protein
VIPEPNKPDCLLADAALPEGGVNTMDWNGLLTVITGILGLG